MYITISLCFSFVLIVLAFLDYVIPSNFWLRDYLRGTFTETVGIIATLLFVNYLFEKKEKSEKNKFKHLFFKQLRRHLVNHLTLFFQMHQSIEKTEFKPQNLKDYITESFFLDMDHFDFSKNAPSYPVSLWYQYILKETNVFEKSLSLLIDRYIMYLDNESIRSVEKLTSSNFTYFLSTLPSVFHACAQNKEHWEKIGIKPSFNFFGDNGLFGNKEKHKQDQEFKKYLTDFISLVELANNNLPQEDKIIGPQNEPILEKGILHLKPSKA